VTARAGGSGLPDCLVDNSTWARVGHPDVAAVWASALDEDRLVACGAFVMEALYSARDFDELTELLEELTTGLRYVDLDGSTWRLAFGAQRRMAAVAPQFHRRPFADYLIAAAAHQHGLAVLHYDRDYDLIGEHAGLHFDSRWIAPPGSLDDGPADSLRPLGRAITARLAQFTGPAAEDIYRRVIDLLDEAIARDGGPGLPPPSVS
jgi:predicted nucleic acid-binding protein